MRDGYVYKRLNAAKPHDLNACLDLESKNELMNEWIQILCSQVLFGQWTHSISNSKILPSFLGSFACTACALCQSHEVGFGLRWWAMRTPQINSRGKWLCTNSRLVPVVDNKWHPEMSTQSPSFIATSQVIWGARRSWVLKEIGNLGIYQLAKKKFWKLLNCHLKRNCLECYGTFVIRNNKGIENSGISVI